MAWANVSLLVLGGLLMAAPIALHLAMRPKPRRLEFPALRFVAARQLANRRQMRLRHFLLLLLRCLAILIPAAALAGPMISSALATSWLSAAAMMGVGLLVTFLAVAAWSRGAAQPLCWALAALALLLLTGGVGYAGVLWLQGGTHRPIVGVAAPVAAALVIDTSPRMAYRHQNATRLEQAQQVAAELVEQLPEGSQLAVIDSHAAATVFSLDQAAALNTIEQLQPRGAPRELAQVVLSALDLLATSELEQREVYIFSDMTAAAWEDSLDASLAERLATRTELAVYLIDVGVSEPQNTALGEVVLSNETPVRGAPLAVETTVQRIGQPVGTAVELLLEEYDPALPIIRDNELLTPPARPRGRREVQLAPGESQTVRFELRGLEPGVYHGSLRLTGDDALAIDNVRYFTLSVEKPPAVLAVSPEDVAVELATEAIAPLELRRSGQALFRVDTISQQQLASQVLEEYQAVLLLDPAPPPASAWNRLGDFVRAGGGLGVFLGRNATPTAAMSEEAALALLPGPLKRQWRAGDRLWYLAPRELNHPALAGFRTVGSSVPWAAMPVERHWEFGELAAGTEVIARYSNLQPAFLERRIGEGRVVVATTPVTDRSFQAGRAPWNRLPTALDNWPFVVLMHDLTAYLTGSGDAQLNYLVGESAELPNDRRRWPSRYELFLPGQTPQTVTAQDDRLVITFTITAGHYRLKGNQDGPVVRGFSVNLPPEASRLKRVEQSSLDEALGEARYRVLKGAEQIERELADVRVGRSFYPHFLLLAALVLGLEQLMGNMFYRPLENQRS